MAKILSFRSKDGSTSEQHFLTDENDKLSFHTAEDGAVSLDQMSARDLPDVMPDPRKDWSNQELADLFRVRQLLAGAGVPVDTLRGITDEGDPWFVFCHLNGDVFIHMARIDGLYVLDSPNVHRPLRGRDFNELIADFTDDALPSRAQAGEGDTERRVIRLERGGKVRLHPSAMLAALIWTLFLAAEELVMLSPDEQSAEGSDLLDFGDVISADVTAQVIDTESADLAGLGVPDALREGHHHDENAPHSTPDGLPVREAMAQQALAMQQNAYAMGLSTIAIAMGFMSEAVLMDNQRKVLEGLKTIGFTQYVADAEGGPELEQIAGNSSDALLAKLAEFLGLDLSLNTETADASAGKDAPTPLGEPALLTAAVDEVPLVAPKTPQTVVRKQDEVELSEAPEETPDAAPVPQETLVVLAVAEQDDSDTLSMSDLLGNRITQQMEEFQLGQTTVLASFDVTSTNVFSLADFFVQERTTDHRSFDDQAQAFIDFIQAKDTDVGIITFGNEIIMIDRDAFRHDGAETYTFSWETDTGQVISMIGLRAEFQQFDLIA